MNDQLPGPCIICRCCAGCFLHYCGCGQIFPNPKTAPEGCFYARGQNVGPSCMAMWPNGPTRGVCVKGPL